MSEAERASEEPKAIQSLPPGQRAGHDHGETVLLAVASTPTRKVLRSALEFNGVRVLEAVDGGAALRTMQTLAIPTSFIIATRLGDGESGLGLAKGLLRIERTRELPIVLLISTDTMLQNVRDAGLPSNVVPLVRAASTEALVDRTLKAHLRALAAVRGDSLPPDNDGDTDSGLGDMDRAFTFYGDLVKRVAKNKLPAPMMPQILEDVRALVASKEASLNQIGELVRQDQGLSVRVMTLANSAFFARGTLADTPQDAIKRMGANKSLSLLQAAAANAYVTGRDKQLQTMIRGNLKKGYLVALIAEQLAAQRKLESTEEAYTVGMFHNVGATFLIYTFATLRDKNEVEEIDAEAIGTAAQSKASDLNRLVYKAMKLPREVQLVHSDEPLPPKSNEALVQVVRCAMWAADRKLMNRRARLELDDEGRELGLDESGVEGIRDLLKDLLSLLDTCYS